MSQIPFVNQLGDALEEAIVHAPASRRRDARRRTNPLRRRSPGADSAGRATREAEDG